MQGNLADIAIEHFADHGTFPNNSLPVILYRRALAEPSAEAMEALFDRNGWPSA